MASDLHWLSAKRQWYIASTEWGRRNHPPPRRGTGESGRDNQRGRCFPFRGGAQAPLASIVRAAVTSACSHTKALGALPTVSPA